MKYKLIVDKQSRTNPSADKKEYEIDVEELRIKGNIADSLVITVEETYIMRRLSLSEYHVLSVLEQPVKEPLGDLNVQLFEGDNYIYLLDMTGNKFYAEYIVKNEFNELYVTNSQMNSAINQSVKEIEITVSQKLTGYSTIEDTETAKQEAIDGANADTDGKLQNYSTTVEMEASITAKADEINAEVSKKVNEETITGAYLILKINGDTSEEKLSADKIEISANDILNLLAGNTINLGSKNITISSDSFNVDKNGNVSIIDKTGTIGSFEIYTEGTDFKTMLRSWGAIFNGPNGYVGIDCDFALSGGTITLAPNQLEQTNYTTIQNGSIDTLECSPRSLASIKKNFEKLENALDIIKNTDIYKYNFKHEEDTDKKHIGLVIGENYKYSNELTNKENKGADLYSLASVCLKGIQELNERLERLEGNNG